MFDSNVLMKHLRVRYLRFETYKKGFVINDPLSDSEIYLREIMNNSKYFMKLSGGEKFKAPKIKHTGLPDAITNKYQIDFKLFVSSTIMEAQSNLYIRPKKTEKGDYIFVIPEKNIEKTSATRLRGALRKVKTINQIQELLDKEVSHPPKIELRNKDNAEEFNEYDRKKYFEMLGKNKNYLLYLPEEFYFDIPSVKDKEAIETIRLYLQEEFKLSIEYRNKLFPNRDNYLALIYNKKFLFFKMDKSGARFIEEVDYEKSDTFMHLLNIPKLWDSSL